MLKSDLIAILVAKRQLTQKQAELTIETIFESMKAALCKGDNIEIRGLGALHDKNYQGYNGRNPKTAAFDVVALPARRLHRLEDRGRKSTRLNSSYLGIC